MLLLCHSHIHLKVYASKLERRACKRLVLRKVIEANKERPVFQLFFLKDDEEQSVEVKEVEEIDFGNVKERVEQGESVFITRIRKQKLKTSLFEEESVAEQWYFTHI